MKFLTIKNIAQCSLIACALVTLQGCSNEKNETQAEETLEYQTIEWTDLMPLDDLQALMTPPEYLNNVQDGSDENQIAGQLSNSTTASDDPYQKALTSRNIVESMNGRAIKVPGFIVPLEFNEEQKVTEFFLVPYFGACIHVPPPPPNQIIFVKAENGIEQQELYEPFWLEGVVKTEVSERELGTSAYTMELHTLKPYEESPVEEDVDPNDPRNDTTEDFDID